MSESLISPRLVPQQRTEPQQSIRTTKSPSFLPEALERRRLLASAVAPLLEPDARAGLGLRAPSAEERQWMRQHLVVTESVRPNDIGLKRANEHRRAKGLRKLTDREAGVVRRGDEVLGSTGAGEAARAVSAPATLASLPTSVDNSRLAAFPEIRNQGALGACAPFATTYYAATHMTGLLRGWDQKTNPTSDANKLSPKWTYNMINGGTDDGSWITNAYEVMLKHGAPTWADLPYDDDFRSWVYDRPDIWRDALEHRLNETGVVTEVDTDAGMANVKALLNNGYVLNFATYIDGWQPASVGDDPSTSADDAVAGAAAFSHVSGALGAHAATIVGYDDNVWIDINRDGDVDAGEKGALKVANSWGTGWGDGGFAWLAYDALNADSEVAGTPGDSNRLAAFWYDDVYWITARPSYEPTVLAEFTIKHAKRNQLEMRLGVGPTGSATSQQNWSPAALFEQGGALGFDGTNYASNPSAAPAGTFVLDYSDLVDDPGQARRYFLGLDDWAESAVAGTITSFKLTSPGGAVLAVAGNVPVSDATTDGTYAYASLGYAGTPGIQLDRTSLTVNEGGTAQLGLRLSGAPSSNVTVAVSRASGDADLSASGTASVLFTPTNWNTNQFVTVAAGEDADQLDGTAVFQAKATGLPTAQLTVREADDDAILRAAFDTNPGWSTQGGWAFGRPAGGGGASHGKPDPTSGFTGSNVYGVNLSGDYSTSVAGPQYLTTPAFDASQYKDVTVSFRRWLNADYSPYVNATFQASNDGTNWVTLYANPTSSDVSDGDWKLVTYDLSAVADGKSQVRLRWGHEIGQAGAFAYSGWNIDDVKVTGTPVAQPPPPPPPDPEPEPSPTQQPFKGTPFAVGSGITTTIQAEDFDLGGEGVAYHDTTAANVEATYRLDEGVDIKALASGAGHRVNGLYAGEWLEYTLDVKQAGTYDVAFRVSSKGSNGRYRASVLDASTGQTVAGNSAAFVIPNTGGHESFVTQTARFDLPSAGTFVLRVAVEANSTYGSAGNLDWFRVTPVESAPTPTPAQTVTVATGTSAFVRNGSYANTNYGGDPLLMVKQSITAGNLREAYVKFDLAAVASISSAKLRLFGRLSSTENASVKVDVLSASNTSWSEGGLTWNNKPSVGSTVRGSLTVTGTTGKWYEVDLTSFLKAEKAAGRNTVTLVLKAPTKANSLVYFTSDEGGADGPQLVVST